MTFMWLVAWLFKSRPKVEMFQKWNNWGISLAACAVIDLTSGLANAGTRAMRKKALQARAQAGAQAA